MLGSLPVVITPKNLFPTVPPCQDVVECTGIINADTAWHNTALISLIARCQDLMPDPYFFLRRMTNVANVKCLDLTPLLLRRLTSDCLGLGRFALVILRKIDAMGSKFTADSPWKSH